MLLQHRSTGIKLWQVSSNCDKDSGIVVEIVSMCDSEHVLRVSWTILPDDLDGCVMGKVIIKTGPKLLRKHLE